MLSLAHTFRGSRQRTVMPSSSYVAATLPDTSSSALVVACAMSMPADAPGDSRAAASAAMVCLEVQDTQTTAQQSVMFRIKPHAAGRGLLSFPTRRSSDLIPVAPGPASLVDRRSGGPRI